MNAEASPAPDEEPSAALAPGGRLSTGSKVVFALAGGCLVALMLLCAGIALLPILGKSYLDTGARFDLTPEEVAVESRKIVLLQMPDTFRPKGMLLVDDGQSKTHLLRVTYYEVGEGRGTLAMAQILQLGLTDTEQHQILPRLRSALKAQGQLKHSFQLIDSRAIVSNIRGQRSEFYLSRGIDVQADTRMWELFGTFLGEQGPVLLYLRVPNVLMSEEEIRDMLQTIR